MQIYTNNHHEQNQNNFGLRLFGKPTKLLHVENVKNYVDFSYSLSRED